MRKIAMRFIALGISLSCLAFIVTTAFTEPVSAKPRCITCEDLGNGYIWVCEYQTVPPFGHCPNPISSGVLMGCWTSGFCPA
jgi:hypothetical protein